MPKCTETPPPPSQQRGAVSPQASWPATSASPRPTSPHQPRVSPKRRLTEPVTTHALWRWADSQAGPPRRHRREGTKTYYWACTCLGPSRPAGVLPLWGLGSAPQLTQPPRQGQPQGRAPGGPQPALVRESSRPSTPSGLGPPTQVFQPTATPLKTQRHS